MRTQILKFPSNYLSLNYINVKSFVREKWLSKQDLNRNFKWKIPVFGGHMSNTRGRIVINCR